MSFRQLCNIFLADQDERQPWFFTDQTQFPADHWSAVISSPGIFILNFNKKPNGLDNLTNTIVHSSKSCSKLFPAQKCTIY
jgi:hypothetical protein